MVKNQPFYILNSYTNSEGEYIKKSTIDARVSRAKGVKLEQQRDDNPDGYFNFCQKCKRSSGVYLDCAHIESVKSCQDNGYCEKAWNLNNISILCRDCHQDHDGLKLLFN